MRNNILLVGELIRPLIWLSLELGECFVPSEIKVAVIQADLIRLELETHYDPHFQSCDSLYVHAI